MAQQENKNELHKVSDMQLIMEIRPWSVEFTWDNKSVKITLKKGEDLLKIGEILSELLTSNGIENTLETK